MNKKNIKLTSNEIWPLINILNELCYGISVNDFQENIGATKESVIQLMNKISQHESKTKISIDLSAFEICILKHVFEEVFKQIEDWEFQTRIGISKEEAQKIKTIIIK